MPEVNIGVGIPAGLLLHAWGLSLNKCFDSIPYHVGSSLYGKQWRDVDVRVILEDDEWEHWFGQRLGAKQCNARWSAICTAFSLWGERVTGLPIDFQVVRRSDVTQEEWDKARNPLGVYVDGGGSVV